MEYQPRIVLNDDMDSTEGILESQFDLYEQAFVELDTPEEVSRSVDLLLRAANPVGEYVRGTRNLFIQELTV